MRSFWAKATAVILMLVGMHWTAAATPSSASALDWLGQMLDQAASTSYQGTFVYLRGGEIDVYSIASGTRDGRHFQHVWSKNGAADRFEQTEGAIRWLSGGYVHRIGVPDQHRIEPSQLLSVWSEQLSKYYEFYLGAKERVADRACQMLQIRARDPFRYGYQLCIDEQTKLLLESRLVGTDGVAQESIIFTDLSVAPPSAPAPLDAEPVVPAVAHVAELQVPVMHRLPAGFRLMARDMKQFDGARAPVEHWRVTDGLANVSIYVAPAGDDTPGLHGGSTLGAISVYGMAEGGYQVTLMGDVPQRTLKLIAEAFRNGH